VVTSVPYPFRSKMAKVELRGRVNREAAIQQLATLRVAKWPSYHCLVYTLLAYWRTLLVLVCGAK
jgi:hypothetical protein